MRNLRARRVTHDDVRAWIVRRVQPQVVRACDAKRQIVIIARGAAHQNLVTVRRGIATRALDLLGLFLLPLTPALIFAVRSNLERLQSFAARRSIALLKRFSL